VLIEALPCGKPNQLVRVWVRNPTQGFDHDVTNWPRDFDNGDDQEGRQRKVMLSYGLWQRQFGSDPAVIDRQLNLSGETYLVAGVMPPRFQFPERGLDYWLPFSTDQRTRTGRGNF
jgi:hypothetical protein